MNNRRTKTDLSCVRSLQEVIAISAPRKPQAARTLMCRQDHPVTLMVLRGVVGREARKATARAVLFTFDSLRRCDDDTQGELLNKLNTQKIETDTYLFPPCMRWVIKNLAGVFLAYSPMLIRSKQ